VSALHGRDVIVELNAPLLDVLIYGVRMSTSRRTSGAAAAARSDAAMTN